ncbi:sulfotransferase domain-containing protein [Roseimicrobium gellanilyticum]|nr:sulfotransferase domain-containing protein [Roseimicrobium gellanilyticum]
MDFISYPQRTFMPLPEAFVEGIGRDDRFLLAFPRSGSRWMLVMLTGLIEEAHDLPRSNFFSRPADDLGQGERKSTLLDSHGRCVLPNAHGNPRESSALLAIGETPIFRSHHLAEIITRANGPIVYIVRPPAPALYSYYHFARGEGHVPASLGIEEFCTIHLPLWKDHVATMLQLHRMTPGRVLFLTYRDPGPFERFQLEAATAHFGIPASPEAVERALAGLAGFLPRLSARPAMAHPRGVNDELVRELPRDLLHWIHSEAGELYQEAMMAERSRA